MSVVSWRLFSNGNGSRMVCNEKLLRGFTFITKLRLLIVVVSKWLKWLEKWSKV